MDAGRDDLQRALNKAREKLLDLSYRNRLLNFNPSAKRGYQLIIVDENIDQIYERMVIDKKPMRFRPIETNELENLEEPEFHWDNFEIEEDALPNRHEDEYLQTNLTLDSLHTRLVKLEDQARLALDEQGINIFYLVLGFLHWFDFTDPEKKRISPLILMPVSLSRTGARARYELSWTEDDLVCNESLFYKLKADFKLELPRLPDDEDDLTPSIYLRQIKSTIADQAKWSVEPDLALGLFNFGKLRMWMDLGTVNKSLARLEPILTSTPSNDDSYSSIGNQDSDHNLIDDDTADDLCLVYDSDPSQTKVIIDVLQGNSLAVQGPPGTGKSQTIANLIASLLHQGKKVLFVSEKMAALNVVKSRLDQVGLGDFCLELHSHNTAKTKFLEGLRARTELYATSVDRDEHKTKLRTLRTKLQAYRLAISQKIGKSSTRPDEAIGKINDIKLTYPVVRVIELTKPYDWEVGEFQERNGAIKLFQESSCSLQTHPIVHPWRGVELEYADPSRNDEISSATTMLLNASRELLEVFSKAQNKLGLNLSDNYEQVKLVSDLVCALELMPASDIDALLNEVWSTSSDDIQLLVQDAIKICQTRAQLSKHFNESAFLVDFKKSLDCLVSRKSNPFRFFFSDYRQACRLIKEHYTTGKPPRDMQERIRLLTDLCQQYDAYKDWIKREQLGIDSFGTKWDGINSDWDQLNAIQKWMSQLMEFSQKKINCQAVLNALKSLQNDDAMCGADMQQKLSVFQEKYRVWKELVKFNEEVAYRSTERTIPLRQFVSQLERASNSVPFIQEWISYRQAAERCRAVGLGVFVEELEAENLSKDKIVLTFDYSYYSILLRHAMQEHPCLREFTSATYNQIIKEFRKMDRDMLEINANHLKFKLISSSAYIQPNTPFKKLLSRKRKLPSIRQMMTEYANNIIDLKPCFMMSPISVAIFLPMNTIEFDVLIIDEASQVKPEDALGVIARCKQYVIVGDEKQLPPSTYFEYEIDKSDDESDELDQIDDLGGYESILEIASTCFKESKLRWHYRSRHETLIAFSNQEFYDNSLVIFPSPSRDGGELGVVSHYIGDGVYDRGRSRVNRREAQKIAERVREIALESPHCSLGVVAMSSEQAAEITMHVERLRRTCLEVDDFVIRKTHEPFFVKALEHVQGDERDIMLISVGYGKDDHGHFTMNLGPINQKGGWRRMNVLITRAKLRCEIFHSVRSSEFRVEVESSNERRGLVSLKNYIAYAETGKLDFARLTEQFEESPLEESITKRLTQEGLDLHTQVGVGAFRIDIALIHPERPGDYLLGIECDGASYHSSPSARERDRLRQEILENRGWIIHRIWSLDWWRNPEQEIQKVKDKVAQLLA